MATEKVDNFPTLLREFRKRVGLSQEEAGSKLGITGDYISQLETGRKTASPSLRLLLGELDRSPLYSSRAPGRKTTETPNTPYGGPKVKYVPVLSWAQAGIATAFEMIPEDWEDRVPVPVDDDKAFGIRLRGDSMEPRFQSGDVAIIIPQTVPHNGELVIANIKEEGFAFKILNLVGGDPNRVKLTSYNPAYEPMEYPRDKFHWIYPVFSITKMFKR